MTEDKTIYVVASKPDNLYNSKWGILWEILDEAEEDGITYKKMVAEHFSKQPAPDGCIFIDIEEIDSSIPFIKLESLSDGDNDVLEKIKELAEYLFGKKDWTPPVKTIIEQAVTSVVIEEKSESVIDLESIGFEITSAELKKLTIKKFVVEIDGKNVTLTREDIFTLGKVYNLIDSFGYKVKQVIV